MKGDLTRRRFLEHSMLAAAAAAGAAGGGRPVAAAEGKRVGANERLSVAVVGTGGRGTAHARAYAGRKDCTVTYICDADLTHANRVADAVARQQKRRPRVVQDMRRAFDDQAVDVVSTATPNHWHALCAIWAIQAGKDVYVEKPVSHNVTEGRRIVQAARKYGRICQTGTQYRSHGPMAEAVRFMRAGKLGDLKLARCLVHKRRPSIGPPGTFEPPKTVDYDFFSGPAPIRPVTRRRFHYDWHWFWDYGNGDLGNSGIHRVDLARWGLGITGLGRRVMSYGGRLGYTDAGQTPNTQVALWDFGEQTVVCEVRGLKTGPFRGIMNGVLFTGTEGTIAWSGKGAALFDPAGKQVKAFDGRTEDHFDNFIQAVRSRKVRDLNADIEEGHQSSALCHLANISYLLGRAAPAEAVTAQLAQRKLQDDAAETFDRTVRHLKDNGVDVSKTRLTLGPWLDLRAGAEAFADNPRADALLTRAYRKPFVVPPADKL